MEYVDKPKSLRKPLVVPHKLMMGPGPSNCPPRVLHALSQPILGHLHPETTKIMDEIKEGIQYMFQTRNEVTLALSTSGHGGMEAVMCNLLEAHDTVLIATNGIWGERATIMATRYGANVVQIKVDAGASFGLSQLESAIAKHKPVMLFIVQGESSTGVYQPLEGLGEICHSYNCLLAVDCVASLGGVPMQMDAWGIDALYTGSQKTIGAPPGLTPISFSARAMDRVRARKAPPKVYYWDVNILGDYWACFDKSRPRVYHHTVSATLLYGLREALALVAEEGNAATIERHRECARRLHAGLRRLGLTLFVRDEANRLPTVTTIEVPERATWDWKAVVAYAMKNYLVEISGGLGPTAGKVLRIGVMGYNATPEKVDEVLQVLGEALKASPMPAKL